MFQSGPEYAHSSRKRGLDMAVFRTLQLPAWIIIERLHASIKATDPNIDPTFRQQRIGQNGEIFEITKTRTLHPDDNRTPINEATQYARANGTDELEQLMLVRSGIMSIVGFRPLPVPVHEEIMDSVSPKLQQRFIRTVLPTRPGMASTFSIVSHEQAARGVDMPEAYVETSIQDVIDGSTRRDMMLLGKLGLSIVQDKLNDPLTRTQQA